MIYDVKRTAWVDYDLAAGGNSGYEIFVWPVLLLLNVVMWLPHWMRGRGYTLHVHDESGRRLARERYGTRAEAEAALAVRRDSAGGPRSKAVGSMRERRVRTAEDRPAVPSPTPAAGDMDGPFRQRSAPKGSSPAVRGDR